MAEVKFEVGKVYRNRDSEYEVLSVDPKSGRMEVRFQDGLCRSLDMATQSRIVQNMDLDTKIAKAAHDKATAPPPRPREKKSSKTLGQEFPGMQTDDFQDTVVGTTWRSKASLAGGLLARLKRHFHRPFASRPARGWPTVYMSHQPYAVLLDASQACRIAKYYAEANSQGFHYGLYLESSDDECHDWERFVRKLREDEALRDLATRLEGEGLRVVGQLRHEKTTEPLWEEGATWEDRLRALEAPPPEKGNRALYLQRVLTPEEAVARGTALVGDVGDLFVELAPFYEAAVRFP